MTNALKISLTPLLALIAAGGLHAQTKGSFEKIKVHGKSLEGNLEGDSPDRDVSVYLPPSYATARNRRYPVVYLLHGYTNSDEGWFGPGVKSGFLSANTTLPAVADKAMTGGGSSEMILVMPNAYTIYQGSMFSNSVTSGDWEGYVTHDLVAYIDSHYRTVPGQFGEYARRASKQTSQIADPPDGRIPPLPPEGQKKQAAVAASRRKTPETWTDWSIYDRCITRGVAGSILPVVYGNGLEIVQAPGYVAIRYEMVHDARIIPVVDAAIAGRVHMPSSIRSYMGDPVGHWEGNTLVVETTNFNDKMGIGPNGGGIPQSEDMKLTERFTRVADNTIDYELTVDGPKTYTSPWKIAFPITHEPGYQLFEYACHEGNMAMRNMITGTLAEQAVAAAAKKN